MDSKLSQCPVFEVFFLKKNCDSEWYKNGASCRVLKIYISLCGHRRSLAPTKSSRGGIEGQWKHLPLVSAPGAISEWQEPKACPSCPHWGQVKTFPLDLSLSPLGLAPWATGEYLPYWKRQGPWLSFLKATTPFLIWPEKIAQTPRAHPGRQATAVLIRSKLLSLCA